jgi:hypothetical protein
MKLNEIIQWAIIVGIVYVVYRMMTGGFSGYEFRMTGSANKIMVPGDYQVDTAFKVPLWNGLELQKTSFPNQGKWGAATEDPSDDVYVIAKADKKMMSGGYRLVTADTNNVLPNNFITNPFPANPNKVANWGPTLSGQPWNVV